MLSLVSLAVLFPAAAQIVYDLPPLRGGEQDKEFRTQAQVSEAARRVLEQYADKTLASWGILDVTKAPYNAKGDGTADNTDALQRALRDARDARMVTWLPPGTYLVRDTLQCVQGAIDPRSGATGEDRLRADDFPCVLQGAGGPRRAVIRLAENAEGFGDPNRPRPLILIWARRWEPPYDLQPNVSFNQMLISIDVDIRDNAGAIGIDMQGAQGTAVQDVRIEARGAFAGMRGLPGSGGSTHQITVRGGRYGVYAAGIGAFRSLSGSQPSPLLAAATLTGQTVAAIHYAGRGPLTVVGARVQGRGIVCEGQSRAYNGGLNLVDSSLETEGAAAIQSNRPVYINNTYVRGAKEIVRFSDGQALSAGEGGWTWVREYAGAPKGPFPVWLDRVRQSSAWVVVEAAAGGPSDDLQSRHALPDWVADWDSPGLTNVRQAPYNATGDGKTDDADAIQRALDEQAAVFLPKGRYKLGRPLVLPPGRKLTGVGRSFTVLLPVHDAAAFREAAAPSPLIDTVDDREAETAIDRLELRAVIPGAYALRWRAGRNSVVRDVNFRRWPSAGSLGGPFVLIEGHGGGRWFNFVQHETMPGDDYRHLLVRSNRQPLTFYMFNPEHARSEVITEFIDAQDVTIYSLKGETFEIGNQATGTRPLIRIKDSRRFRLFGAGGICGVAAGSAPHIYRIENSSDLLLANAAHQIDFGYFADPQNWSVVSDGDVSTPGEEFFVLYKRGEQQDGGAAKRGGKKKI
ncbi:MAG: glycosyl hydrolase family 28-related protein [Acidobacteriota bacterium]